MMFKFRINLLPTKTHKIREVHVETCSMYHELTHFEELGEFIFCSTAVQKARNMGFESVYGCQVCSKPCGKEGI